MSIVDIAPVVRQVKNSCYQQLDLYCPDIARSAHCGQFVTVDCGAVLNRPFSIFYFDSDKGIVSLLYQLVGRGTQYLSQLKEGDQLRIIGPLGKGYSLSEQGKRILVAAGGVGIASLYSLLEQLLQRNCHITLLQAGRSADNLIDISGPGTFIGTKSTGGSLEIIKTTDDGSAGLKGLITEPLIEQLEKFGFDYLYTCGPAVMLKAVRDIAGRYGQNGEMSVEERMGCGIGACLSCACRIKDAAGQVVYKRTCVDGPVFSLNEVVFDD